MPKMFSIHKILVLLLVLGALLPAGLARAQDEPTATPGQTNPPTPGEVIEAINNLRLAHGLNPLTAHPVLMEIAAIEASGIANGADGHWRPNGLTLGQWMLTMGFPLSGDLSMDGYRSENWVAADTTEDAIAFWLSDDEHTNTMLSTERSDIGAGVAISDAIYVVVETALRTASGQMQYDARAILTGIPQTQMAYSSMATEAAKNGLLPQYSMPVAVNTPLAGGNVYHTVQYGQSLWGIAIAYHTTIKQLQALNNLADTTIQTGQKLLVMQNATLPAPPATPVAAIAATRTPLPNLLPSVAETPTPEAPAAPDLQLSPGTVLPLAFISLTGLVLVTVMAVAARKRD